MISIDLIQRMVAEHYGIQLEAMRLPDRHREWAWPRQMAMGLACEFTEKSRRSIGKQFRRDGSTVLQAQRALQERAECHLETLQTRAMMRARLECLLIRADPEKLRKMQKEG
jgi:chromosomal replication initiation ATPase DnaA